MPKLLSVTMLHRHGSRGPGASELTPWSDDHPIKSQWKLEERENLSSVGRLQCELLGQWYVNEYINSGALETSPQRVFWRCSKSDRAKESGEDFVRGFNNAIGYQAVGEHPEYYSSDADNYFRPWKIFKEAANDIKDRQNTAEIWKNKTEESKEFLTEVFTQVGGVPSLLAKPQKALWACTYLHAIKECEEYWPHEEGDRHEFSKVYLPEYESKVTELALWVWEQRFLYSGYKVEMGGRMAVDILEHVLNLEHSVNFFSGHDYTLLGTICALNLVSEFKIAMNFSAFVLFEFWDSPPNNSTLLDNYNGPVIRVLLNPTPFKNSDGSTSRTVQTSAIRILNDYKLNDIVNILQELRSQSNNLYMKPLKTEKETSKEKDLIPTNLIVDTSIKQQQEQQQQEQDGEIDMLS